jgi:hypothetical protein
MSGPAKRIVRDLSAAGDPAMGMGRIIPLRPQAKSEPEKDLVLRLRTQMALIQGYTSMLDTVSPAMRARILAAIAKKTDDLVVLMQPYHLETGASPTLADYRRTRMRTQELLKEFRALMAGLRKEARVRESLPSRSRRQRR